MERSTRQRRVIQAVFTNQARPLSPAEVHKLATAELPKLGIATVYRTIRDLESDGIIQSVSIASLGTLYEPARSDHHHHFYCRVCGRVFEVNACHMDVSLFPLGGCIVEEHETTFRGVCEECAGKSV